MKKVEVHVKSKYSKDYDSVIDVESIIYNSKENGERGIIFVDKDSIYSFVQIEEAYNRLLSVDKTFKDYKIGYGVELTVLINNKEVNIILLVKNNNGLNNLYKIINKYNNLDINYILDNKEGLLLGLRYQDNINLDIFDYVEINDNIILNTDKLVVYSNIPNVLFEGDKLSLEVLQVYRNRPLSDIRLYKDTEDTLKDYNNKEIVIDNSNKLLDMLDKISIIDDNLYIENGDYDSFKELVIDSFNNMYKNPSNKMIERLNKELELVKELHITSYFNYLIDITNFIKNNNEHYIINGYTNNSLISYVLGITRIEPYNLPYELFYSNNLSIDITVEPTFYYKKLYKYVDSKYNLVKCRYGFKINKDNVFRVIKNYEIKTKNYLSLEEKDYISNNLIDIPLFNDIYSNSFYIIPNNIDLDNLLYDYHKYNNNFIKLKFILSDNIKYMSDIKLCNNRYVYDLFRLVKEDIIYFEDLKYELKNKPNLWFEDLVNMLAKKHNLLIGDDIYNYLVSINIDDIDIFRILNELKDKRIIIPKANLINKSYLAYSYLCNKYLKE